jgi:hypothetical protein
LLLGGDNTWYPEAPDLHVLAEHGSIGETLLTETRLGPCTGTDSEDTTQGLVEEIPLHLYGGADDVGRFLGGPLFEFLVALIVLGGGTGFFDGSTHPFHLGEGELPFLNLGPENVLLHGQLSSIGHPEVFGETSLGLGHLPLGADAATFGVGRFGYGTDG